MVLLETLYLVAHQKGNGSTYGIIFYCDGLDLSREMTNTISGENPNVKDRRLLSTTDG